MVWVVRFRSGSLGCTFWDMVLDMVYGLGFEGCFVFSFLGLVMIQGLGRKDLGFRA